jgi:hypothetical protein
LQRRLLSLPILALACASPAPPAAPAPSGSSVEPAVHQDTQQEARAETANSEAAAPADAEATDAGPRSDCTPRGPELGEAVCASDRLDALLAELGKSDGELGGFVRCEPLSVRDLEAPPARSGRFGDLDQGNGFFGDLDVNRDGKQDRVLLYTSVDYWAWFVFVREASCLRFVDAVEGYQVELLAPVDHGIRRARVLTYPLQGRIETLRYDGRRYVR